MTNVGAQLKVWTWSATQLLLDPFRAEVVGADWRAVIAEGRFLPGDAERTFVEYGNPCPFVSEVLWALQGVLLTKLVLEQEHASVPIRDRAHLESLLPELLGRIDYRLDYCCDGQPRAIAFDLDLDWLVVMCHESWVAAVEAQMRKSVAQAGHTFMQGP